VVANPGLPLDHHCHRRAPLLRHCNLGPASLRRRGQRRPHATILAIHPSQPIGCMDDFDPVPEDRNE
jgi:hypothetical protein